MQVEAFFVEEPRLLNLITLCQAELFAEEIWLFGSRARGDHRPDSDWDVLVVARDGTPAEKLDPISAYRVARRSGVNCDLLTVTKPDFEDAKDTVNTLSYAVKHEGIRLD